MARKTRKPIRTQGGHDLTVSREEHNKLVDEMDELKTNFVALLAKLDTDAANTALDDVDYESTLTPVAAEASKITAK